MWHLSNQLFAYFSYTALHPPPPPPLLTINMHASKHCKYLVWNMDFRSQASTAKISGLEHGLQESSKHCKNIWFGTWTAGVKQALQKYLVWNMDCRSQASTAKYVVWNMDFRSFPHAQSLKKATKLTQNLHQRCHRFHTNCSACKHAPNWKWAQFTDDEDVNCSS